MTGAIVALNTGSSSVRFALFDAGARILTGHVAEIGLHPRLSLEGAPARELDPGAGHAAIIAGLLADTILPRAGRLAAVGHRVVHGGTDFAGPARIDPSVRARIAALAPLAPAHQPHALSGIDAVTAALPDLPQVACFDTAFHRTIPEHRQLMPLPRAFAAEGLRRFGFHGLSYQSIRPRLPAALGARADGRVIICHLGNGCSLAALDEGRCLYTSMGFTPLDGLMMGRRPGRLDPGAVLWLVEREGGDLAAVTRILNQESGLLGVSGRTSDMRSLLAAPDAAAALAVTMFVDRLTQEIAAAAAALGGLDALVFTGGIGENAAPVRARTLDTLGWLGLELDAAANDAHGPAITRPGAPIAACVIATDEEQVIADQTAGILAAP